MREAGRLSVLWGRWKRCGSFDFGNELLLIWLTISWIVLLWCCFCLIVIARRLRGVFRFSSNFLSVGLPVTALLLLSNLDFRIVCVRLFKCRVSRVPIDIRVWTLIGAVGRSLSVITPSHLWRLNDSIMIVLFEVYSTVNRWIIFYFHLESNDFLKIIDMILFV